MIKELFLEDSYLKECDATVVAANDGKYIVLGQTIFYPKGGGQPHDTGQIIHENDVYNAIYVGKFKGNISHEVDKVGLKKGDKIQCILDWKRRYKLMRSHTAAHALAAILERETGALITGNQLEEDIHNLKNEINAKDETIKSLDDQIRELSKFEQMEDFKTKFEEVSAEYEKEKERLTKLFRLYEDTESECNTLKNEVNEWQNWFNMNEELFNRLFSSADHLRKSMPTTTTPEENPTDETPTPTEEKTEKKKKKRGKLFKK